MKKFKENSVKNVDISDMFIMFVNFVFQSEIEYQLCIWHINFLIWNY